MKSIIFVAVLFSTYCYCSQLLGGWSVSDDQSLKQECLQLALVQIQDEQVSNDIQSQASDLVCHTQIVNGLNIKCDFTFRGQPWRCSYYKSFVQTLGTSLDQCEQVKNTDQQVREASTEEKDDEAAIDALNEEGDQSFINTINEEDDETVIENK